MPTLLRLLVVGSVLAALAFGLMTATVTLLRPQQRDISQSVTLPEPAK